MKCLSRWRHFLKDRCAFLAATVSCLFVVTVLLAQGAGTFSDPIPIQRLHLPAGQLPLELQQHKEGILREMPRSEFETRVQKAAQVQKLGKQPPRLAQAHYTARLEGNGLVGQGTWHIANPDRQPGVLALKDLRLALKNVKLDGTDAVLGLLDGAKSGLLLPGQSGEHIVKFDWSLGGGASAAETYFDFQAPACVSATLELNLPDEHLLEVSSKAVLLTSSAGPAPGERLWRLDFSGKAKLSFTLHRVKGAKAAPPVQLVQVKNKQTLWPNRLEAEFTFHIEILNNAIEELVFPWTFPAPPTKVSCSNVELKSWEMTEVPAEGAAAGTKDQKKTKALVIRFHEPKKELPPVRVSCQLPLAKEGLWISPGLHLRDSLTRGETLALHIHPDVHLDQWQEGTFRLAKADKDTTGFDVLVLEDNPTGPSVRPRAKLGLPQASATVKQVAWWQVGQKDNAVIVEFTYQINQGRFHELSVELPREWGKGWQLQAVELKPKELARKFALVRDGKQQHLVVELQRGVGAGELVTVRVAFRYPHATAIMPAGLLVDFPRLRPLETVALQGTLGISVDPLYQALALQTSAAATVVDQQGPWANTPLNFFFTYRDQPVTGKLRLVPQLPQFQASLNSVVMLAAPQGTFETKLQLEPVAGTSDTIDLLVSAPLTGKLKVKNSGDQFKVASLERMPQVEAVPALLAWGNGNSLIVASLLGNLPSWEIWRIKLAQPLNKQESLVLEGAFQVGGPGHVSKSASASTEVPLVAVLNAAALAGKVHLHAPGLQLADTHFQGVTAPFPVGQEKTFGAAGVVVPPGIKQQLQFTLLPRPAPAPSLWVQTKPLERQNLVPQEQCDVAWLKSFYEPAGHVTHQFTFRIKDWSQATLPMLLPAGTEVLSVKKQDKWINQPLVKAAGESLLLELPADAKGGVQSYQITYRPAKEPRTWLLWTEVDAAVPRLPVPPLTFTHSWFLPPGVAPLDQGTHGPAAPASTAGTGEDGLAQVWSAGEWLMWSLFSADASPGWEKQQRAEVQEAAQQWHAQKKNHPAQLATALRVVVQNLPARTPLILDTQALQAAGLGPETAVPAVEPSAPFWERLGLTYLPFKGAAVLTSKEQARVWIQELLTWSGRNHPVGTQIKQAVRFGYDPSGRFQSALTWVAQSAGSDEASVPAALGPDTESGWTEWRPLAPVSPAEGMYLINQQSFAVLGYVLAGVVFVFLWRWVAVVSLPWRVRLTLLWAAAAAASLVLVPAGLRPAVSWPAWTGLVVLAISVVRRRSARTDGGRSALEQRSLTAALLLLLGVVSVLAPPAVSGQAKTHSVYVLGPAGAPWDKQTVLAPVSLLEQLEQMSRPPLPSVGDAVLVGADYQGRLKGGWVEFQATFQVYCFSDKAKLLLPLKGVQLLSEHDTQLQGKTVYPVLAGAQSGYVLPIDGFKQQLVQLTMHFKARVLGKGDFQEINVGIPRLAQNHLQLALPADAVAARALTALGRQWVAAKDGKPVLEADLGTTDLGKLTEGQLWVGWHTPAVAKKTEVEVSEFHLADVRPTTSSLVSVFRYNIKQGSVSRFQFLLPDPLHLRNVQVDQPEEKAGSPLLARVRDVKTIKQAGGKLLEIELDAPVSGVLQLTLGLLPTAYHKSPMAVLVPTPLQVKSTGGLLGYLSDEATLPDAASNLSITKVDAQIFAQEWLALRMPDPGKLHNAYRFQRFNPKSLGGLLVHRALPEVQMNQDIRWTLHPNYARVDATLSLENCTQSTYVKWEVPAALTVAQLSGPALIRWSVSPAGAKKYLHLWLADPKGATAVNLTGWLSQGVKQGPFLLPRLSLAVPNHCPTTVQIGAVKGLVVRPVQAKQMTLISDQPDIQYQTKQSDYAATLSVDVVPVRPQVQILTLAERLEGVLKVTAWVHYTIPVGELKEVTLVARDWHSGNPQLEAPRTAEVVKQKSGAAGLIWKLKLLPGTTQQYALKVTGTFPIPGAAGAPMPALEVTDAEATQRWLAVLGPQLQAGATRGIVPIQDPSKHLVLWSALAEQIQQGGELWKVENTDWHLQLMPGSGPATRNIHILWAEQSAAPANASRWLQQSEYLFVAEPDASLQLSLPPQAQLLVLNLDGKDIAFGPISPEDMSLTVPASPLVHHLSVRWTLPSEGESGKVPLASLRVHGSKASALLFSVQLPVGYALLAMDQAARDTAPLHECSACLHRAAGQLKQTSMLVSRLGGDAGSELFAQLTQHQKAFYRYCWEAEQRLQQGVPASAVGPSGQSLRDWLKGLQDQNRSLAAQHKFESLRQAAEKQPVLAALPGSLLTPLPLQGTPATWYFLPDQALPDFRLVPSAELQQHNSVLILQVLLVVLIAGLVLSFIPGGARLLRWLWPELLFAGAATGVFLLGFSLVGVVLLALAVGARLLWLVRAAAALLKRRAAPVAPGGG